MAIALLITCAVLVTFALGYWLRSKELRPTWVLLAAPLSVAMLWGGGSLWIFSAKCSDIQVCDSGGFLAFTAGMTVALAISLASSILGFLLLRIVKQ
jgi:hypothetical protein